MNLIKKHIDLLKEKINKKDKESKLFLNDVSTFLDQSVGDYNRSTLK